VPVFDLKPGEVSQVLTDASGHYIYKLDSKEVQPLDSVKVEIKNKLQSQNTQDALKQIQDSFATDMNDAYFGANPAPAPAKN
jgi:parvulin-like peptidyl-prolyl isomerase